MENYNFEEFKAKKVGGYTEDENRFIKEAAQYLLSNPEISRIGLCKWSIERGYINRPVSSLNTKIYEELIKLRS